MDDSETTKKIIEVLEEYARNNRTIHYSELYARIGLDHVDATDRHKGAYLLGKVNDITLPKSGVFLTALVTSRQEEDPYEGFFNYAIESGEMKVSSTPVERLAFWAEQVKKVFKKYQSK